MMPAEGEVETSLSSYSGKGLCQSTGPWAREEQVTSPYPNAAAAEKTRDRFLWACTQDPKEHFKQRWANKGQGNGT